MAKQLENHEIDKLVGQHVMGWTFVPGPEGSWYDAGVLLVATEDWSPTTDIHEAWQIVDKLRHEGHALTIFTQTDGWGCATSKGVDAGYADTAPMAICLAALAAVGTATG